MAITATVSTANTYFAEDNNTRSSLWGKHTSRQKSAALATAKRVLTRYLRESVTDLTVDAEKSFQPDYAIYEQALFELITAVLSDGNEAGPKWVGKAPEEFELESFDGISVEASRWLPDFARPVQVIRG